MWICPKCGEKLEKQFHSCWKCAAQTAQTTPSAKVAPRWKRALLLGVLFEIGLVLLAGLLPKDSWLFPKAVTFLLWSHYPLLTLLEAADPDSAWLAISVLLLTGIVMATFWAILFHWGSAFATALSRRIGISKKLKLGMSYSLVFLTAIGLVWAIVDAGNSTATPFTASTEVKAVVEGNTAFALDLYQRLKERPGNLFFSPYSISTALAVLYAGAGGLTESEIASTLHFTLPQTNLHVAFGDLTRRMEKVERWNRITLLTANSLWCQQDYPFTDTFLNLTRTGYKAEARLVDFKESAHRVSNEINAWVEGKTKGKIKDMAGPGKLGPDSRMILCNAIYFKGKWASQFKRADTEPAPFFIATNQTVTIPMMYQKAEFRMAMIDAPAISLIELPYYGRDLSMVILLPESVDGLPELEQHLTADSFRVWLAKLDQASPHKTSVHLPRFTTTQGFELANELRSLGMPAAFDILAADFSGIDGINYLYLSDAFHKAFVEVNEAGTEAAAATLVRVASKSMSGRFTADHPFVYLIRENGSGSILFLGRIVDPTKS